MKPGGAERSSSYPPRPIRREQPSSRLSSLLFTAASRQPERTIAGHCLGRVTGPRSIPCLCLSAEPRLSAWTPAVLVWYCKVRPTAWWTAWSCRSLQTKTPDDENNMRLCGFAALVHHPSASVSANRHDRHGTHMHLGSPWHLSDDAPRLVRGRVGMADCMGCQSKPCCLCIAGGSGTEYARSAAFGQPSCLLRHAATRAAPAIAELRLSAERTDGEFHRG